MSLSPTLLIVNSDNCVHCTKLVQEHNLINADAALVVKNINCIWIQSSRLVGFGKNITHFPYIVYFPDGQWAKFLDGDCTVKYMTMPYTLAPFNSDNITNWMSEITKEHDAVDEWSTCTEQPIAFEHILKESPMGAKPPVVIDKVTIKSTVVNSKPPVSFKIIGATLKLTIRYGRLKIYGMYHLMNETYDMGVKINNNIP